MSIERENPPLDVSLETLMLRTGQVKQIWCSWFTFCDFSALNKANVPFKWRPQVLCVTKDLQW